MLIREKRNPREKRDPLVRNKLDMLLRERLLRERSVRKELSDSPNTSKRYGCASLEGSKRAKLRTILIDFWKKGGFQLPSENRVKKQIVKGIVGEAP